MWLKAQIGQRRIRHGEIMVWRHMLTILRDAPDRDSSVVLRYWGAWVCRVSLPQCMYRKLVTQ